jgi:hypothetical protein
LEYRCKALFEALCLFIQFDNVPALASHVFIVRGLGKGAALHFASAGPGYGVLPISYIAVLDFQL